MLILNRVMIVLTVLFLAGSAAIWLKRKAVHRTAPEEENDLNLDLLIQRVKETIENILAQRPEELNLTAYEMEKRIQNRKKLSSSIRSAPFGDLGAKIYVKDYISNLLLTKFNIQEGNIDRFIPFHAPGELTVQDKFEILLQQYKKEHEFGALKQMFIENSLDQLNEEGRHGVYEEDIHALYNKKSVKLHFVDMLEVLCQRIYQSYIGNGVIDEIRDMDIEGVSGGVSGIPEDNLEYLGNMKIYQGEKIHFSHSTVWILLNGKTIPLFFLGFGSKKELIRVSKNIYRYNNPGQLSEEKGYIENDMRDGSRVVVARPGFSDSWVFWIRKHQSFHPMKLEELIPHENSQYPIRVLNYIIKGCRTIIFTGGMYSGKTTLLKTLIECVNPNYNLRIQESIFELWLRKIYSTRNITTFRELPNISGERVLEIQKRTDGTVHILGELLKEEAARWIVSIGQAGSKFTMCTHHAKRTGDLLDWILNAFLNKSGMKNESLAMKQVADAINFDVHCGLNEVTGERYIERITEVVPVKGREIYKTVDIVTFDEEKRSYQLNSRLSEGTMKEIRRFLPAGEQKELDELFKEARDA